jgi:hypothetical protein
MPSFSDLPGCEGVLLLHPALVSQSLTRSASPAAHLKDQHMKKTLLVSLACAGLTLVLSAGRAATITEDFSSDPLQHGWQVFGDTNLFAWNPTNRNLEVTWDSRHPNSYFHYPLGVELTRYDDFSLEFDLRLSDIASGVEPDRTGPLQIGFGFVKLAVVTDTNFVRSAWGGAPNIAELDYYPYGYFEDGGVIYPSPSCAVPTFISGTDAFDYAPAFVSAFNTELPTNQTVHIRLAYTGGNQTALLTLTTNGVPLREFPPLVLNAPTNSYLKATDNFHVDTFSISSYTSVGAWGVSVLAHGTVGNLTVATQFQPISRITAGPIPGGSWQAEFFAHSNWLYTLDRSVELGTWVPVSLTNAGAEDLMLLQDADPPPTRAFYRVRTQQP